jgi:hypothetical protein
MAASFSYCENDKKRSTFLVPADRYQAVFHVGMADIGRNSRALAEEGLDFID